MAASATGPAGRSEVAILAQVLGNGTGRMSPALARHVLTLGFGDEDKSRMHELAEKNRDDRITPAERDELLAYVKAGDLLGILKSKARRSLGAKPSKRRSS
jgi:hypothetical protein